MSKEKASQYPKNIDNVVQQQLILLEQDKKEEQEKRKQLVRNANKLDEIEAQEKQKEQERRLERVQVFKQERLDTEIFLNGLILNSQPLKTYVVEQMGSEKDRARFVISRFNNAYPPTHWGRGYSLYAGSEFRLILATKSSLYEENFFLVACTSYGTSTRERGRVTGTYTYWEVIEKDNVNARIDIGSQKQEVKDLIDIFQDIRSSDAKGIETLIRGYKKVN